MKKIAYASICLLLSIVIRSTASAACDVGRDLYNSSLKETDLRARIGLLEKSVEACETFEGYYQLGVAYMKSGLPKKAEPSFRDAKRLAGNDQALARAVAGLGQVHLAMERPNDAILCFRRSHDIHPYPGVLAKLKEIESRITSEGMSAEYIVRALNSPTSRALFGVEPSLDIRVHFRFDSAELDEKGKNQVERLGKALTDPVFAGGSFTLIGHTDKRGTEPYNQLLSEHRAETVKRRLVQRFDLNADRIRPRGRGETALLYPGDGETEHALNRRVEVRAGFTGGFSNTGVRPEAAHEDPYPGISESLTRLFGGIPPGRTIAFVDLTDGAGAKTKLANEICQRIEPVVIEKGMEQGLRFLERRDLTLILEEWKLDMAGLVQGDSGARHLLGADLLLTGGVSLEPKRVLISFKLIQIKDGRILSVRRGSLRAEPIFQRWADAATSQPEIAGQTKSLGNADHRSTSPDGRLSLWSDAPARGSDQRAPVHFSVTRPMYVTVFHVSAAGATTTIFPDRSRPNNHCLPGKIYHAAPAEAPFESKSASTGGIERIKAIGGETPPSKDLADGDMGIDFTKAIRNASPTRAMIFIESPD